jgi:hypothetical protein
LSILKIPTAKVFEPLLAPARYKGLYGGRGSGKSHFFGELLVETCQAERATLAVCIREAQRTLAQSSKRLIESKIAALGVGSQFKLFNDKIETPGDGLIIFRGMQQEISKAHVSLGVADPTLGGVAAAAISDIAGILPPRSWPNERKRRFRSLPYDMQLYLAGHEEQRDKALRRAQNEAAIARQKLMASERSQPATSKGTKAHDPEGNQIDASPDA